MGHCCRTLSSALVGTCRTLLRDTLVGDFDTKVSTSQPSRLQNWRFAKSDVKVSKTSVRARLPQQLTLQVCKTRISHKTSSTSHKKLHVKVSKTSISYETPSKSQAGSPSESTHQAPLPSGFTIPALQPTPAHMAIPMSQRRSPPPCSQPHGSLHFHQLLVISLEERFTTLRPELSLTHRSVTWNGNAWLQTYLLTFYSQWRWQG